MKISEIIRGVLDLIDSMEQSQPQASVKIETPLTADQEQLARIKQIAGLTGTSTYTTEPNEQYADIDAVTVSGTDINKSKHPADIRGDHFSLYSNFKEK